MKPRDPKAPTLPARQVMSMAVMLAFSLLPATGWPQLKPDSPPPPYLVSNDKVIEAQAQAQKALTDLKLKEAELKAAMARVKTAEDAAKAATDRAAQAQKAKPEGVPPEQLDSARKERDSARAERDAAIDDAKGLRQQQAQLQTQLKEAQAQLKRAQASTNDEAALREERDKLRRDNTSHQLTITALRGQVVDKDKALAQAARDATQARVAATAAAQPVLTPVNAAPGAVAVGAATLGTSVPATSSAVAALPADLTELTVPNCGAACPSFIVIPNPGKVTLGNGTEASNEAITADIRHRFAMGKTEVTLGQWKAFWNDRDRDYQPVKDSNTHCNWDDAQYAKDDRHPVRCVNVLDAEAYARWFEKKYRAALGVRIESIGLPSELEWELAARGGRYAQKYLWDDGASDAEKCKHAQVHACPGGVITVASRLKNGYNLHDMIGNTWEWTASPWQDKRSAIPSNGREAAAGVSSPRVVRGASFGHTGDWLALGSRGGSTPGFRSDNVGFRLVARIAP